MPVSGPHRETFVNIGIRNVWRTQIGLKPFHPLVGKMYVISGVTRDSGGNPLGNCTVRLFYTANNVLAATTLSDGSGNFSFSLTPSQTCYVVAYLPGSPDVTGATVNTLIAT